MMNQTEQEKLNWIHLYLYARNYRIDNDHEYLRVYHGEDCVMSKQLGTNKVKIFVVEIDCNDLKAIMEVI